MSIWNSIFDILPVDGSTVFIRVLNYYGEPVSAVYNDALQVFTTVTTGVIIPIYYIVRWRN
jgi:hypothetical protein